MSDPSRRPIKAPPADRSTGVHPSETVLWPIGIVHGPTAKVLVGEGLATWLAGGPSAFTAIEIIEGIGSACEHAVRPPGELADIRKPAIVERTRLLTSPRSPIAGLTWVRPRILSNVTLVAGRDEVGERSARAAIQHGQLLAAGGADIVALSVGRETIDDGREASRIEPVVAGLAAHGIRVAVATRRPSVMRVAARAGARVIIDDAPTVDDELLYTLGDVKLPVILRRNRAVGVAPRDSRTARDFAATVHAALEAEIELFEGAGIPRERLIIDPGTGARLPIEESLAIRHALALFHGLGCVLFADCADSADTAGSRSASGAPKLNAADAAFAALIQGVQIIGIDDSMRAWSAVSAFRALAAAQFKERE